MRRALVAGVPGAMWLGAALALASPSKPQQWTRARLDQELLAQGLAMTLPATITGEGNTVFDAKFITLHAGDAEIWVGVRANTEKNLCSLEFLRTHAKDESGFRAIESEDTSSGIPVVTSSHRDDNGHDTFLVQACPGGSLAICGAEKLNNLAAAKRVASLCGTLRSGAKPADVDPRVGAWVSSFLDDKADDRTAGRGGSGKRVRAVIDIRREGIALHVTYTVGPETDKKLATSAVLGDAKIVGDTFSATPPVVKAAWPYYVPAQFDGKFTGTNSLVVDGKTYKR